MHYFNGDPQREKRMHALNDRIRPSMPRGNPKRRTMMRLPPDLVAAVAERGVPLTHAVEQGLALWLAQPSPGQSAAMSHRAEPAGPGIEPGLPDPKSGVLPLDEPAL
jgi:hypothetical protein